LFDFIAKGLPNSIGKLLLIGTCVTFTMTFVYFQDFSFGMQGPDSNWASRQWLSSWNIYGQD
jgi:dolichyl-phosphate-mannose--protein O-mannosyl transferase